MTISKTPDFDIKPSEVMRNKRPELYSDSETIGEYKLNRAVFSHHLASLTERNEHKQFEEFCRALAQRELCRNLRPQTGPEGGGDGKVDSETYPVAEEVANHWYEGRANPEGDKWAFAFSAKKTWSPKVRSDVKGIVETKRGYNQIAFFTNQNPRAKKRLEVEDELEKNYGVPVTIYDRNWIEEKVLQHGHQDLAYDILGVGEYNPDAVRKGANDTYRESELADIEAIFAKPDQSHLTDFDLVPEALRAATLSRGLERPRYETDGRFDRAIKWADSHGTQRQQLVARYEKAWTAIWWFDDIDASNAIYSEIEDDTLKTDDCFQLEKLGNLLSIMVGRERFEEDAAAKYDIEVRHTRLSAALEHCAKDKTRPNHALYAETLLELQHFMKHMRNGDNEALDSVWVALSSIIDRAAGLGEYPAELLSKMMEVFTLINVESEALDELVYKMAEFMGSRRKDGTEGLLLLKRGQQKLDAEKPLEAIAWIGKAALSFNKKEYEVEQVETLYCLAVAYRAIDLHWAARSCALSCLVKLMAISEAEGEIAERSFPATRLLALICLQLGHLPDALQAIFLLKIFEANVGLSAEGDEKVKSGLLELDQFLACMISVVPKTLLPQLATLPDFLDHIQFYTARLALLYRLGYRAELRQDQSIPEETSDEELDDLMSAMAAQPASRTLSRDVILNEGESIILKTKVLGVDLSVEAETTNENIAICELLISTVEGFMATMLNRRVMPLTSQASVRLTRTKDKEVEVKVDEANSHLELLWPKSLELVGVDNVEAIQNGLLRCIGCLIGLISTSEDATALIEDLFKNEMVFARSVAFSHTTSSHSRVFGRDVSRLGDLPVTGLREYHLLEDAPEVKAKELPKIDDDADLVQEHAKTHSDISVHTVINQHLWDRANWRGTAYMSFGPEYPPVIGLMFEDIAFGKQIFKKWQEEIGREDKDELIRVSILKGIEQDDPLHYVVHVSANFDALKKTATDGVFVSISRLNTMEPTSSQNLDRFLEDYNRAGCYFLVPVEMKPTGPEPIMDLRIFKRNFSVSEAWQVGPNSQDVAAIKDPDRVFVPDGETNAPVHEIEKARQELLAKKVS